MAQKKRKDKLGRNLRNGEFQEKNGRYRYTYRQNGRQQVLYSWRLQDYDSLPAGKRECVSLRSQIKELEKARILGIEFHGSGMSVETLVMKYIEIQKKNPRIRVSTLKGYETSIKHIKGLPISHIRIDLIKNSDAIQLLESLHDGGYGYSTISHIHSVLKGAFNLAMMDRLIWYNPFSITMKKYVPDNSKKRDAFTENEKAEILRLIRNDGHYSAYVDGIEFLFETGLRISEFCGLSEKDINWKLGVIKIDKQLCREKGRYMILPVKTEAGARYVPLSDRARECLTRMITSRTKEQEKVSIDSVSGFLQFDRNGMPRYGSQWSKIFEHIWKKYSSEKGFRPEISFSPHICRHTFSTLLDMKNINPHALATVMGHADTSVTYKVYSHLHSEYLVEEFEKLGLREAR